MIIYKKNLGKYQSDEDSSTIKSIIYNKKCNSNRDKEEKEKYKIKEKENAKAIKKNTEKLKFVSTIKSDSDSPNKKTAPKDENNIKDINGNKNNLNKNNISKNIDSKNTIIINNINSNKVDEINMNRVGLIQINNNQFENNNFNNYSKEVYNIKNNLKQNNNNILINNLNNNYNNNYFGYSNISSNLFLNQACLLEDIKNIYIILLNLKKFTSNLFDNIKKEHIDYIFKYKQLININLYNLVEIMKKFNYSTNLLENRINTIKYYISNYQKYNSENKSNFSDLINRINILEKNEYDIKIKYKNIFDYIFNGCYFLTQIVDNIIPI